MTAPAHLLDEYVIDITDTNHTQGSKGTQSLSAQIPIYVNGRREFGYALHRYISNMPPWPAKTTGTQCDDALPFVDHIDRDRRNNLRPVTHAQNCENRCRAPWGKESAATDAKSATKYHRVTITTAKSGGSSATFVDIAATLHPGTRPYPRQIFAAIYALDKQAPTLPAQV